MIILSLLMMCFLCQIVVVTGNRTRLYRNKQKPHSVNCVRHKNHFLKRSRRLFCNPKFLNVF